MFEAPFISSQLGGSLGGADVEDFDGDGLLDVAITRNSIFWRSVVAIAPGRGDGSFGEPRVVLTLQTDDPFDYLYLTSLVARDLNRDGKTDLAICEPFADSVMVLLGLGGGTFGSPQVAAAGYFPEDIAVGDVDGDDIPDLVVAPGAVSDGTVSMLLGNGDGTFKPRIPLVTGGNGPVASELADLNDDGDLDLSVADYRGFVSVLLGDGHGGFSPGVRYLAGLGPAMVRVGDLDGDHHPDLVVANGGIYCDSHYVIHTDSTVTVLMGNGDGAFAPKGDYFTGKLPQSLALGDLNGDGVLDLAVGNQLCIGTICWAGSVPAPGAANTARGAGSAGLRAPIVAGVAGWEDRTFPCGKITVLLGDGHGGFGGEQDYGAGLNPGSVVIRDFDRDDHLDVFAAHMEASTGAVFRGNGDGTLDAGATFAPTGDTPVHIATADLNGDGTVDFVVVNREGNSVTPYLGSRSRVLTKGPDVTTGIRPAFAAIGDLDRDGVPDLVVANEGDRDSSSSGPGNGTIDVFHGDGAGGFGHAGSLLTNGGLNGVVVADLNGDGRPDLAATSYGPPSLFVFYANMDGFAPPLVIAWPNVPHALAAGDMDGDGQVDLITTGIHSPSTWILKGEKHGLSAAPVAIQDGRWGGGPGLATADFNDDGLKDIAMTGFYEAVVLLGRGGDEYSAPARYPAGQYVLGLVASDFDGDGKVDLALTDGPGSVLSILRNSGGGTFQHQMDFGCGAGAKGPSAGDLDADGRVDIVTANAESNTATILWNRGDVSVRFARAFLVDEHRAIPIGRSGPQLCIQVEPVAGSFAISDVDPSSVYMASVGTGAVDRILAVQAKSLPVKDMDSNGVSEFPACFSREEVGSLFSRIQGRKTVDATVGGRLASGGEVRATVQLQLIGGPQVGHAAVWPNPLNPTGTLRFETKTAGYGRVQLFDIRGRLVRTLLDRTILAAGPHEVMIDGTDASGRPLGSGIYLYRVEAAGEEVRGTFVLVK